VTTQNDVHLSEADIFRAMVDEGDLPSHAVEHLAVCGICRGEKKRIEEGLARMTRMARQLTPTPLRKPSLDRETRRLANWLPWGWGYALSAGIVATAIVMLAFTTFVSKTTRDDAFFLTDRETIEDEQFMAEIARLEEDGLPPVYTEISGTSDADSREDPVNDDNQRGAQIKGIDVSSHDSQRIS
jgi:hypothetical protein